MTSNHDYDNCPEYQVKNEKFELTVSKRNKIVINDQQKRQNSMKNTHFTDFAISVWMAGIHADIRVAIFVSNLLQLSLTERMTINRILLRMLDRLQILIHSIGRKFI